MEALLKHTTIAWNPVREVRRRHGNGTLRVQAVLVPFLTVVIACNVITGSAQQFFYESLAFGADINLPDNPLVNNGFAQRFMASLGILIPALAISILPAAIYQPAGRNTVVATVFIVGAAWAFYGAVIASPVYFIAGLIAATHVQSGMAVATALAGPSVLLIIALVFWFWVRALRVELWLAAGAIITLTATALVSLLLVAALLAALIA